ncbi:hypothetical protein [Roseococcus suduntuyensis]|uniref:Uncharacterized protein n=1 Tax=Roseococcus suduntuyensis TaxID=455361 RepID=A0A840AFP3_9PROT|nr:hypothetical protein [Roseococcus suduntuyensis]MBB3899346.1 hypothetical protein [Roseococcus suduntuyensis]
MRRPVSLSRRLSERARAVVPQEVAQDLPRVDGDAQASLIIGYSVRVGLGDGTEHRQDATLEMRLRREEAGE